MRNIPLKVFLISMIISVWLVSCSEVRLNLVPELSKEVVPKKKSQNIIPDNKLPLLSSVTKDGVTWTFNKAVSVGQFVNGDYYVVGPVTITNIDPLPTAANGLHGSVLNIQGNLINMSPFDHRVAFNRYRPQYRVYPPFEMKPGDTLVSSISIGEKGDFKPWLREGHETPYSYVRSYSILTCLAQRADSDAFRPAYSDRTQRIYKSRYINRNLLPNLPHVQDAPDIKVFAAHFRRPWMDIGFDGLDAAVEYQAVYGREVARAVGMATLLLMLDYKPEHKEELLINIVQYAIDLWGLVRAGHPGWPAHGGHGSGRKWPILFAGIMLGDQQMQQLSQMFPNLKFGEDMHTAYGNCWTGATVVYTGHQGIWNGKPVNSKPSWGPYEHRDPSVWNIEMGNDNPFIGEDYRRCCTSVAWVGEALAARIMSAMYLWNHKPFFDYVDRWMMEDDEAHISKIRKVTGRSYSKKWQRQGQAWDGFVNNMWGKYRNLITYENDVFNGK